MNPYDGPNRRSSDPVIAALEARIDERLDAHEAATAERAKALEDRIDKRLEEVIAKVEAIGKSFDELEQEKRESRIREDALEEGRRQRDDELGIGPESSAPRPNPLLDPTPSLPPTPIPPTTLPDAPRGWDRLAAWLTGWTPYQVIMLAGVVVGGPVGMHVFDRVFDATFGVAPPAAEYVEDYDAGNNDDATTGATYPSAGTTSAQPSAEP